MEEPDRVIIQEPKLPMEDLENARNIIWPVIEREYKSIEVRARGLVLCFNFSFK